jgi:hypothetical protein
MTRPREGLYLLASSSLRRSWTGGSLEMRCACCLENPPLVSADEPTSLLMPTFEFAMAYGGSSMLANLISVETGFVFDAHALKISLGALAARSGGS